MRNTLFIDTSDNKKIAVGFRTKGKEKTLTQKIGVQKAQVTLILIERLLQKHGLSLKDIDQIEVNTGPGSFTGLRVGIAVANALSFALKIPVNKKKVGKFVEPTYQ